MKKIIIVLALFITLIGCDNRDRKEKIKSEYKVVVIDSCEYIIYTEREGYAGYGFMTHKGNCKFCEERRKESKK